MNRTGSELLHSMLLATSALVASTMLTSSGALAGGPSGGKVAAGSATITNPSSTQTVVDQTSQKALINWNSFSVPTGSSITFEQPNITSLTVNRVLGPNASTIDGQLLANGNIWLINANGILFGHGSQVDVGALLATTSDLSDDDFRKGRYRFTKPGNPGASVVNQGSITAAPGGSVVLSGSQVSNQGVVQANLGTVVLGGANAFTVDLDGDNLLRYQITAPVTAAQKGNTGSALVSNSGTIAAAGGRILLTARAARNVQDDVINNTGQIEANTVSSHDGEIDFDAGPDGTVNAGGTISASGTGAGQTGGAINIAGGTVNVTNGATINASGDAGGGTIQVGGGLHGKGTIANSNMTNIGNATISANAITKGNGGTIAIWSNGTTSFAGTVSATGGAQGGNGGLVETSGGNVQVGTSGKVVTSAAKGTTGDWLIDPTNIDIVTGGTDGIGGSNISPTTVINALGSTNVTLEATNDITISNDVDYSSANTLSLLASQDIIANASIQNSGAGAINLIAGWDGVTTNLSSLTNPGVYGNNNGSITIGGESASGNVAIGSAGGTTTFAAANLTIEADNGYAQAGYHGAGGGNLVADLTGNLTLNSYDGGEGIYAQIGNGSLNGDVSGNITGNISINAGGATTINVGEGGGTGWIGNFANEGYISSGNLTLITGTGDLGNFGIDVVADLGSTNAPGSGGDVLIGFTEQDFDISSDGPGIANSPHNFTLLSTGNVNLGSTVENSGTGNITVVAGWDGTTTNLSSLTTSGVYGNNGGSITIGGENAFGNVAVGSAGGTTTFAASDMTIEADNGYAQAGYHGTGGGNLVADLTEDLTLTANSGEGRYALFGNGSLGGDVSGKITGNISINVAGNTVINIGEGGGTGWIGNFAGEGSIESGNVTLITGEVQNSGSFGGSDSIGAMLIADLGTTSAAGSGGTVTFGLTKPTTDFINDDLDYGAIEYNSPNALTLLSTGNITLPYSIQNDGTGALTILAGWNPAVAPANVLTTPGAYGNTTTDEDFDGGTYTAGADVWVVGDTGTLHDYNPGSSGEQYVDSGAGVAIGSMGGTTTIGAAQIYVEGLSGYAQIGYHNTGGTGAINVIANGTPGTGGLTGIGACFDGDANICVIGGRSGDTDENNDPSYAQIGDLGLGVAGTASSNISVTATGNIAVAGGGIYSNAEDPQIPNAYGMIGNGDGAQTVAQTVSGTINVNVAGQLNFGSSTGTGSEAWLGNRTGSGGLASGDVTAIFGSENDSGPVDFGNMIFADLGTTGQSGSGGNVTVGQIDGSLTIQNDSGLLYNSPNNLTVLSGGNIDVESALQNSGTGNIMLVAGWNGTTLGSAAQLENANAFGLDGATITVGGSNASGDAMAGTAGGTMTVLTDNLDVESDNGIAQLGFAGAGTGAINVVALGDVTVDALNGNYAQIGNGGSAITGNVGGAIGVSAGGTILVESDLAQSNAAIGNIGGASSSESGGITLGAGALDINSVGQGSNAFVGNGSIVASTGGATGDIGITSGDVSLDASGDGSQAFIGDGVRFNSSGTTGGNINLNSATLELVANESDSTTSQARIANRGVGNVVGTYDIVTTGDIQLSASDANLAAIGNGEAGSGTSSGGLTVQSGGTLTLASTDGGQTRIGDGAATDSIVDVSAAGDIDLSVTGNPGENGSGVVLIGNLGGAVGGNISVTSTGGSIDLNASEDGSAIQIGNIQNGVTANVSGNILVSAQNNVTLEAAGQNTAVQIGNGGTQTQGNDAGSVTVTATTGQIAATLNGDGGFIQLGNGGNASVGTATGDTNLTAGTSVQLSVGSSAADSGSYIQVGDGAALDATTGGGNIVVNATSISTTNSVDFVGNSLDIALTGAGDSIGANSQLRVTVNDLALSTNNGNAFVYSTQAISLGVGEGAINLGSGGLDLASADAVTQTNAINAGSINVSTTSGAITLTNADNAITLANLTTTGSDDATLYDSSDLTISGANIGGDLTLLTRGNLTFTDSAIAGGAVLAVAGWDGTTTSPSALTTGTAYGNNGGSITIGGAGQDGNVDIGSASGSTTLAADNVSLTANSGFVQVGYNGAGSGNIDVVASGNVTVTAGTQKDDFAQIGNGGWNTSGNESGSITVDALGTVALNGGSGQDTYAQIGHGGTASNSNSEGYNDTGLITVDGQSVALAAGSSQGSYAQIGNGGYQSGQNSSGTLTLGGDINVNAVTAVTLTGNGQDAYAQIGNGGDFVNTGATNNTTGTISGDIDVLVADASNHTSPDPVSLIAGSGADSYAQIGNGGNGENTPAAGATVTFNISGNVTVADLTLQGSDTGQDGYAQVGNGAGSATGTGNISGDITIGPGIDVTIDNGTAPGTGSMIGNDTGFGTITGTITGYTGGSTNPITTAGGNGAVATTSQTQVTPTDTDVNVVTVTPENTGDNEPASVPPPPINQPPGPLDQLADNGNSEGTDPSDALTSTLGQSLDSRAHNAPITVVKSIIPGVLSEVTMKDPHGPHGVPPADEDYSSWGNEALWQW